VVRLPSRADPARRRSKTTHGTCRRISITTNRIGSKRAAARGDFAWSALRPEAVCGFAVGNPMNLTMAIAVYAAICGELGVPFSFPGKPGAWTALYEVTDARILAQAAHWASTTPSAAGRSVQHHQRRLLPLVQHLAEVRGPCSASPTRNRGTSR